MKAKVFAIHIENSKQERSWSFCTFFSHDMFSSSTVIMLGCLTSAQIPSEHNCHPRLLTDAWRSLKLWLFLSRRFGQCGSTDLI